MCNPRAGRSAAPTSAHDGVLGLLRDDFGRVLDEFREFERLESLEASQACQRVAQRTFAELKVIAAVEEQLLYPAVRGALQDTDLIDQSEIEHACIKRLIDQLEIAEPTREDYPSTFRILGAHVRRHVEDEELELFPALPRAPIDWHRLYELMRARRSELAADLGIAHIAPPPRRARAQRPEPAPDAAREARDGEEVAEVAHG